jgi:chromosome segregation protein
MPQEQQRLAASSARPPTAAKAWPNSPGQVAAKRVPDRGRRGRGRAAAGRRRRQIGPAALEAEREFAALEASIAVDEEGEEGLDAAYEKANAELAALQAEQERLREQERTAERDRQSAPSGRAEALALSLTRRGRRRHPAQR